MSLHTPLHAALFATHEPDAPARSGPSGVVPVMVPMHGGAAAPAPPIGGPAASPAASDGASEPVPAIGRRKLWQIPAYLHCLVIGTCLSIDQVRHLATRAGYEHDALNDYDVHHACVHAAANRHHPLAIALQRACEANHARHVRRFARERDREALRALWSAHREEGDIAGPLWALVTHAGRDDELVTDVFGEVHMLQHGTVLRENTLRQGLAEARSRSDEALAQRDAANERLSGVRDERDALSRELDAGRVELERLRARLRQRDGTASTGTDAPRLLRQERLIVTLRERDAVQRQALSVARRERVALSSDVQRLECVLARLLDRAPEADGATPVDTGAPALEPATLCGRCVLVIGGQPQQCRHFRALVEAHDGVFLHHDGGVESKAARVADLVKRADAVVCPTEQISHDAMKRAKRLCRAEAKPMLFLHRSSLAAFADSLATLSDLGPQPPVSPTGS